VLFTKQQQLFLTPGLSTRWDFKFVSYPIATNFKSFTTIFTVYANKTVIIRRRASVPWRSDVRPAKVKLLSLFYIGNYKKVTHFWLVSISRSLGCFIHCFL